MIRKLAVVGAFALLCGCSNATDRTREPSAQNKSKELNVKQMDRPFMEHPSGEFETAVDAMADAIRRLRTLPEWNRWITFHAQGMGGRVDSYHFAAIRMRQGEIAFEEPVEVDIQLVTKRAGVPEFSLSKAEAGYSLANATPIQGAQIMDAIFRQYLGIQPHTGEGDDYAVGAEW